MSGRTNPYIREVEREIFNFSPTEEITRLTQTQKVNQKVNLSFYGRKIEMPFKLLASSTGIELIKDVAVIKKERYTAIDAYKLEITHPLGKMYCRFDVPREIATSTINGDAITISELNMKAKRDFEDYLINRKQYDIEFETMDLSHRQARLARKYEWVNEGIDFAMNLATAGVVGWRARKINTRLQGVIEQRHRARVKGWNKKLKALEEKNTIAALNLKLKGPPAKESIEDLPYRYQNMHLATAFGAYKGISGMASGIAGLISTSERASLQEEGFAIQIREKALRSYEIDLGFERDKEEQLFTMRRIFANETYNQVTDRQRQRALDELESPAITDEIYLEVWTTSDEQEDYAIKYHEKFGVDCRVVKKEIPIRDDMRLGIYCMEDVEIYNLTDRVDFEYLKARLTGGIRFIQWEEFKGEKEFHPVDELVKSLKSEIVFLKKKQQEDSVLTEKTLSELRQSNNQLHNQVSVDADRYHELTENYKKKEAELQTQTNLAVLYKNEADHFKADLLKKDSEHAQEKEDHSGTKQKLEDKDRELQEKTKQLEQKTKENQTLTSQIDSQLVKIQECEKEKELQQSKIQKLEQEVESNKDKNQEIEKLKQQNQAQVQQINELARKQLTTVQELEETKKSLEAVREIETQKDREIEELKKGQIGFPAFGFFKNLFSPCCANEKPVKLTVVVKTPFKGAYNYAVAEWDDLIFGFKWLQGYRVWAYDSYKIFTIGPKNKERENAAEYWYTLGGYFNQEQTTWEQFQSRLITWRDGERNFRGYANAYKNPVFFIGEVNSIPLFDVREIEIVSPKDGVELLGKWVPKIYDTGKIYWDSINGKFTQSALNNKEIKSYKEYLEVIGMYNKISEENKIVFEGSVNDRGAYAKEGDFPEPDIEYK